jgi:hypothetical protein
VRKINLLLQTFLLIKKQTNMAKKKEETRDFNFSDGNLSQLTDEVIGSATRDTAEMTPNGVTVARLDALKLKNEAFIDLEDDEEWAGLVSEKTDAKDIALEKCESRTRSIRRMAGNIFGENSSTYRRFGFEGINTLPEVDRIKAYFRVHRRASEKLVELTPEGLTAVILTDFNGECDAANLAYDEMVDTIKDRDIATEERIKLANEIYGEVVKIANTGKDVWYESSEAKYNDYVITESGTTVGQKRYKGIVLSGAFFYVPLVVSEGTKTVRVHTPGANPLQVYFAATNAEGPNGYQQNVTPVITNDFVANTIGWDASRLKLMIYNPYGIPASFQVDIL